MTIFYITTAAQDMMMVLKCFGERIFDYQAFM